MPRSRTTTNVLLCLLALGGVLAACSAAREPGQAGAAPGDCDASRVDHLIGENVSGYIERLAMRESGAQDVRVLKPDSIATMDFNARRLNIHTDPGKVIIKLSCG
ncbi:I78 family peptidase inhibitor [Herbaspirillum sp. WKF16]|uniref:I78 family peptidase inhibitor n=1 Tax=Herbaspirillum sp. WKF16 TaxID=3028312 RepID=UPI0023A9B357|nr:I78 family peptidase inhibitor [Herbaspirillum sp. WKF16]WDZ97834.1 I78 family peptidase inhibitor [Herbaspirillum sp. WKF16]